MFETVNFTLSDSVFHIPVNIVEHSTWVQFCYLETVIIVSCCLMFHNLSCCFMYFVLLLSCFRQGTQCSPFYNVLF